MVAVADTRARARATWPLSDISRRLSAVSAADYVFVNCLFRVVTLFKHNLKESAIEFPPTRDESATPSAMDDRAR